MSKASVADVVGATVAAQGVRDVFGVLGSGNLVATNALRAGGARFHAARHEGGATSMADGYARATGRVGVVSVHQGPGLTNTLTGLAEAAKSRSPLLVLSGETPAAALTSSFRIDQHDLVESVGAIADRVHSASTAADDAQRAHQRAQTERRPVVLMMPTDIQQQEALQTVASRPRVPPILLPEPNHDAILAAADLLQSARRPAIIAGLGAVVASGENGSARGGQPDRAGTAAEELERLGELTGAVLATSAPANGLFAGLPYALGISGEIASPHTRQLLPQADVVLVFGASVNHWTTSHGALIGAGAKVIQIDLEARAIARNHPVDLAIIADAAAAARALADELVRREHRNVGWRTPELAAQIATRRWRDEPFQDASTPEWIDPRTFTIAISELLPADRLVVVDSGHFLAYPAMFLDVPDARSWLFVNGFQAVGLGLGNAIGAAVAAPDRTVVAALGDGGTFLALQELETAARLGLGNLLVLIYDDAAYGSEVHHFEPLGHDVSPVRFQDADLAGIARAAGAQAITVRNTRDLGSVKRWLSQRTSRKPLVVDAKINPTIRAAWLGQSFRAG